MGPPKKKTGGDGCIAAGLTCEAVCRLMVIPAKAGISLPLRRPEKEGRFQLALE
jgi:hypothetical protein